MSWPWSSPMEWRAHVPQGEHVLPGWEDSVDVAAWLIDPKDLFEPGHAAGRAGDRLGWRSEAGLGRGCARRSGRVSGERSGGSCGPWVTAHAFDGMSWAGHDR